MSREELVACFQDTLQFSKGKLRKNTISSIKSNKVYKENFLSKSKHKNEHAIISVHSGTTFDIAKNYSKFGRIAVLNFANPEVPGGGVCNGAMAQEECLCRSSNLYVCINDKNVFEEYYGYHRGLRNHFYSDRLIYTKDITVFKNDHTVPQLMPEDAWFQVDVITCAAPYIAKRKYTNSEALLSLFRKRIKNIFEAARDNKADTIVLGAFGCGAFKNPPFIVVEAFKQVIEEENYLSEFKHIVFAIKPTGDMCPNLATFSQQLDEYVAYGEGGRTCLLPEKLESRFTRKSSLVNDRFMLGENEFFSWQETNKYYGKQFSIIGDSISTLNGYNPRGYKVFYTEENAEKSGIVSMQDTWWDKVISYFGGELLINNSWSGSRVTKLPNQEALFPSGCSDERTSSLHINEIKPDVVIVYLGTNDWAFGARTGGDTHFLGDEESELFEDAYNTMLRKIKFNYPKAEIWCCTLSKTFISCKPEFSFPHKYGGTHIEKYNEIIRRIAIAEDCKLIDLYNMKMPYDSIDGSHPNKKGMQTIATSICYTMSDEIGRRLLALDYVPYESKECSRPSICIHEFIVAEEYTGGTKYICKKCGFEKHESILAFISKKEEEEYVFIDPEVTSFLYDETISLTDESTGKEIKIRAAQFDFGRNNDCMFKLDRPAIASKHATFFYERSNWFIRDNNSSNGTRINGTQIEPAKKYQLLADDVIEFSDAYKYTFYKTKVKNENTLNLKQQMETSAKECLTGKVIGGKYQLQEIIGMGGMTKVYLATDDSHKKFAVKSIHKNEAVHKVLVDEMHREVALLRELDHSYIRKVVEQFEDETYIFIVMEYIEGINLDALAAKTGGILPVEKVIRYAVQIAEALQYIHTQNPPIINRDIKPRNILIDINDNIKLVDFDIAMEYNPDKEDIYVVGTKGYAAPEQYAGITTPKSDIFALGIVMHQLLTGVNPVESPYEKNPIRQYNPNYTKTLEQIIEKCTRSNQDDRFVSCAELIKVLKKEQSKADRKGFLEKLLK